jgi:hypothetical protein
MSPLPPQTNPEKNPFWESLLPVEKNYWEQWMELFSRVHPQKPEKGIQTLILRARVLSQAQNIPLEEALSITYLGSKERTERRLMLLGNACKIALNQTDTFLEETFQEKPKN